MTTYSIREFKAKVSEILRNLDDGEEMIITRRGRPCGRLTAARHPTEGKPSLSTLRGSLAHLPDATYEDFVDIKSLWEPRVVASDEAKRCRAG
jgi:prevent-host-death family protein